ncbi:MAG: nucleotidyltransferase family protein [Prevotellaceae bacterium]|nr:nucleotidyltransferase family protein [Prevotellaceae bacterium]
MDKFFQLVQIALGRRDGFTEVPTYADWLYMMDMARRQALIGICVSAIEKLPEVQCPPKQLMRHWAFVTGKIEQRNKWLNLKCGEITALLSEAGFSSCMLKGQGMAALYPEPLRRQSGDIDVLVISGEGRTTEPVSSFAKRVIQYARGICRDAEAVYHHVDIQVATTRTAGGKVVALPVNEGNKIEVELHYRVSWFYSPLRNIRLQKWFARQCAFVRKSPDATYFMPTNTFNVIFILVHIYRHLFDEGIGLRQCLDYYYVMKEQERDAVSLKELRQTLSSLGLTRFCAGVMYVLHEVFGLEEEHMIVPMNAKEGEFLLKEILLTGNFGQYTGARKQHENLLSRFARRQKRNLRFLLTYPEEVISAPFWILWHRIWRWRNGYIVES